LKIFGNKKATHPSGYLLIELAKKLSPVVYQDKSHPSGGSYQNQGE
jgi:hypothetical protein